MGDLDERDPRSAGAALRPAREGDVDAIAALHVRSWRAAYAGIMPEAALEAMTRERSRASLAGAIEGGEETVAVAVEGGALRGFLRTGPTRAAGAGDDVGEIVSLYLDPDERGRGLGRLLIRHGFRELAASGFRVVCVYVLVGNDGARRFYEREGLTVDGPPHALEFAGLSLDHHCLAAELDDLPRL